MRRRRQGPEWDIGPISVFLDTGPLLARHLNRDRLHEAAEKGFEQLETGNFELVTSTFVLTETLTLLARRSSYAFAAERAHQIYEAEDVILLRPEEQDELAALERFEKFADQKVSFTDCVSFALMWRYRISRAFTFDRHFRLAGLEMWPLPYSSLAEPEPSEPEGAPDRPGDEP